MEFQIGDMAMWGEQKVMIVDVHGWGPSRTADLRWTIGYDSSGGNGHFAGKCLLRDEISGHKRNVPMSDLKKYTQE